MKIYNQLILGAIILIAVGCSLLECSRQLEDVEQGQDLEIPRARSRFLPSNMLNFEQFKMNFNKHYNSIVEELYRRKLYLGRALTALASMVAYKFNMLSSYKSVNHMSDMTMDQLKQTFSISRDAGRKHVTKIEPDDDKWSSKYNRTKSNSKSKQLPDELFHDYRNCMNEVRDQGQCGACTMFSTVALYEWMYCKSTGKSISFSEQFLLDCGGSGCGGGFTTNLVGFINEFGLEVNDVYPYFERKKRCPFPTQPDYKMGRYRIKNAKFKRAPRDHLNLGLDIGPMLIVILVDVESFHAYGGGVDQALYCNRNQLAIDKAERENKKLEGENKIDQDYHAVVLVGDGREDGQEYWLIRNSHGSDWGEEGYYKLSKTATDRCIEDEDDSGILTKPGSYKFYKNPKYNKAIVDRMAPIWHDRLKNKRRAFAKDAYEDDEDYVVDETITNK